jgi:hypothetical protein
MCTALPAWSLEDSYHYAVALAILAVLGNSFTSIDVFTPSVDIEMWINCGCQERPDETAARRWLRSFKSEMFRALPLAATHSPNDEVFKYLRAHVLQAYEPSGSAPLLESG